MLVYESEDTLDQDFTHSTEIIRTLTVKPSNDELLQLYGLFKQATIGNNNTDSPNIIQLKEKAKWNFWYSLRGISKRNAKTKYNEFVINLIEKYPHS